MTAIQIEVDMTIFQIDEAHMRKQRKFTRSAVGHHTLEVSDMTDKNIVQYVCHVSAPADVSETGEVI